MKVAQINSFYYNRGGDCTHMFATTRLLEKHGHQVVPFSMQHPQNFSSPYAKYWPSYIDYREMVKKKNLATLWEVISRTVYSVEAKSCMERFLKDEKPDIVHVHNILHHITPSIFGVIKKHGLPIVLTLHDYTILCPNTLFLTDRGEICEACKKIRFYNAPLKRCKKNSFGASLIAMVENYAHRIMRVYDHVDLFIAPSDFLRKKFEEYGFKGKVLTLNNFVTVSDMQPCFVNGKYIVYIGRLSHIKGLDVLMEAMAQLPQVPLKIVGEGELLEQVKARNIPNVECVGFKSGEELKRLVANASFSVLPSRCYENFPYSVLETMSLGKPVIGARIGGIPELVRDGETGYTFAVGNAAELREKIAKLFNDQESIDRMGRNARRMVETQMDAEIHYEKLLAIYNRLLATKQRRNN